MHMDMEMLMLEELQQIRTGIRSRGEGRLRRSIQHMNEIVRDKTLDVLRTSELPFIKKIRDAGKTDRDTFLYKMEKQAVRLHAQKLREILDGGFGSKREGDEIEMMLSAWDGQVEKIGNRPANKPWMEGAEVDTEMEQILQKIHEQDEKMDNHFTALLREGKVVVRRMVRHDITGVKRCLYNPYKFTGPGVVDRASGIRNHETFYGDFEGNEEAFFEKMFDHNAFHHDRPAKHLRREMETAEMWVVVNAEDPEDYLAAVVITKSPLNAKNDPEFLEREEKYINETRMHFESEEQKMFHQNLVTQPTIRLAFIGSRQPGAADLIHSTALKRLRDVDRREAYFSYTMRDMEVRLHGKKLPIKPGLFQNTGCVSWAPRNGFTVTHTWGQDPDAGFNRWFDLEKLQPDGKVKIVRMEIGRPSWTELTSTLEEAQQKTASLEDRYPIHIIESRV